MRLYHLVVSFFFFSFSSLQAHYPVPPVAFKMLLRAIPSALNASSAPTTAVLSGCSIMASFRYVLFTYHV